MAYVVNKVTINSSRNKPITTEVKGRKYWTGDVSLMTEGVHEGSLGKLYYSKNQLKKWTSAWNHKPMTRNHPVNNGSSDNVNVIEQQVFGFILNAKFGSKQTATFYADQEELEKIDPDLAVRIENGEPIEVSTGLEIDVIQKKGVWNGEDYVGEAVNHRPDHLAVLPDTTGACSLADGAGLCVNSAFVTNEKKKVNESAKKAFSVIVGNAVTAVELSFDEIGCQITDQLRTRFGKPGYGWYGCICAVYTNYVIFIPDGPIYETFMLGYTVKDGEVSLDSADPTPVERVVTYQTSNGGYVGNSSGELLFTPKVKGESQMAFDKNAIVSKLVGNGKPFPETDRASIEAMSESVLNTLLSMHEKKVETPTPVVNKQAETLDDLLKNASPALAEALVEIQASVEIEKEEIIERVHNALKISKEDLKTMKVSVLKTMDKNLPSATGKQSGMSYSDRVANRKEELRGTNAFAANATFAQFGKTPSGFVHNSGTKIPNLEAEEVAK